jgi:hypothetical protein
MTTKEKLIQEIEQSPEPFLEEFLDFILFAKSRRQDGFNNIAKPRKPIWEIAAELTNDIPPEILATLSTDSAENHDHYLYGAPKKAV